jgi:uncharacterized delta-60 repeat protein
MFVILAWFSVSAIAQVTEEWAVTHNGRGFGYDEAVGIAVDSEGNVIVTGNCDRALHPDYTDDDYVTIKYNTAGEALWKSTYYFGMQCDENAVDMVLDHEDNVYVLGENWYWGGGTHWVIVKYDPEGTQLWAAVYPYYSSPWPSVQDLAVDTQGNAYFTGFHDTDLAGNFTDCVTAKFNSEGQQEWVSAYNGPCHGQDEAYAIDADAEGNVYVTGSSDYELYDRECVTIKYNSDGETVWAARYVLPGVGNEAVGRDILVGNDGCVYVAGLFEPEISEWRYCILKYSAEGQMEWITSLTGAASGNTQSAYMEIDADDNVYFTGYTEGHSTGHDYITAKVNSQGIIQWLETFNGPDNLDDKPSDIAIDGDGNVYVTGSSAFSSSHYVYATLKYDTNGNTMWIKRYFAPEYGETMAKGIAVDPEGNVFVTGNAGGHHRRDQDYCTVKYSQASTLDGTDISSISPHHHNMCTVYPNPFNPVTEFSYQLSVASFVKLSVYDVTSRKVAELADGWSDAGPHEVMFDASDLASGIYLYRLKAGEKIVMGKMAFIK